MPIIEFTTKQVDNFLIKMEKITVEITGIINDITKINNQVIKSKSDLRRVISLTKKIATLTSRRELTIKKKKLLNPSNTFQKNEFMTTMRRKKKRDNKTAEKQLKQD